MPAQQKHRVVIVGGGFAGLAVARRLRKADAQVTVIDRVNHHVFQPLLYQVATGGLSPADISAPIRGLLSKNENTRVLLAEVTAIDAAARTLETTSEPVGYDTLVLATGARHSYFGNEQWSESAPGLKTLDDATMIRRKILLAFEAAEQAESDDERRAWLTFTVIGGGPTGVELAGAIGELARQTLKHDFRRFDPASARVLLIEAGPRILGTYTESLSPKAEKSLRKLGVEVMTGSKVTAIDRTGVMVERSGERERISSRTVLWAAGVQASSLGRMLAEASAATEGAGQIEPDRAGRIPVGPDFSVPGHPEIFVVGDLSSFSHQGGTPLRGTADVAVSEGGYVGRLIARRLEGKSASKPYRFRDFGKLAVIGRSSAVADLKFLRFTGYAAWQFWLFMHVLKLVGFQNRLSVLIKWSHSYFTRNRSARLITGQLDLEKLVDGSSWQRDETAPVDSLPKSDSASKPEV